MGGWLLCIFCKVFYLENLVYYTSLSKNRSFENMFLHVLCQRKSENAKSVCPSVLSVVENYFLDLNNVSFDRATQYLKPCR